MVEMKNIKLMNNMISMDCYKEGDIQKHFTLVISAQTHEILENSLGTSSIYVRQAKKRILQLLSKGQLPNETKSIWY